MPMKNIARQYPCAFCHKMVTICRACDRGHIYCGPKCSKIARKISLHAAGRKYQRNQKGKLNHAERQKRYRLNCKKIVTHHTSKPLQPNDLLPPTINQPGDKTVIIVSTVDNRCYFCGNATVRISHGPYQ